MGRLSVEELEKRAATNEEKGRRQRNQAVYHSCVRMLKAHPEALNTVYKYMCDLGLNKDEPVIPVLEVVEQEVTKEEPADDDGNQSALNRALDRRQTKLENWSVQDLCLLLHRCEEVSLSPFALKALCPRRSRVENKSKLLELVERGCGVSGQHCFDLQLMGTVGEAIAHLVHLYTMRGRLLREVVLPADWNRFGVYHITPARDGKPFAIIFRDTGAALQIPEARLKSFSAEAAEIQRNWSTTTAVLVQTGVLDHINLSEYRVAGMTSPGMVAAAGKCERKDEPTDQSSKNIATPQPPCKKQKVEEPQVSGGAPQPVAKAEAETGGLEATDTEMFADLFSQMSEEALDDAGSALQPSHIKVNTETTQPTRPASKSEGTLGSPLSGGTPGVSELSWLPPPPPAA